MTHKKELNQEELDKVTGGAKPLYPDFAPEYKTWVRKYDVEQHVGEDLYFEDEPVMGTHYCFVGTLLRSYEQSDGCGTTLRMHEIIVRATNHPSMYTIGQKHTLKADDFTCYSK